jgi:hypothetical protein
VVLSRRDCCGPSYNDAEHDLPRGCSSGNIVRNSALTIDVGVDGGDAGIAQFAVDASGIEAGMTPDARVLCHVAV